MVLCAPKFFHSTRADGWEDSAEVRVRASFTTLKSFLFIVKDVEDRQQLCDNQESVEFFMQVQKRHIPAGIPR